MAGETGRARYAAKTATLTFASATYDMASGPIMKGETAEAVDVTALSDSISQYIPGAVKTVDSFTVAIYMKGSNDITVGATGALTISVTLENGVADATATVGYNNCIVTKVSPSSIEASGDRKAVYDVTFQPDGSVSAQ